MTGAAWVLDWRIWSLLCVCLIGSLAGGQLEQVGRWTKVADKLSNISDSDSFSLTFCFKLTSRLHHNHINVMPDGAAVGRRAGDVCHACE